MQDIARTSDILTSWHQSIKQMIPQKDTFDVSTHMLLKLLASYLHKNGWESAAETLNAVSTDTSHVCFVVYIIFDNVLLCKWDIR